MEWSMVRSMGPWCVMVRPHGIYVTHDLLHGAPSSTPSMVYSMVPDDASVWAFRPWVGQPTKKKNYGIRHMVTHDTLHGKCHGICHGWPHMVLAPSWHIP